MSLKKENSELTESVDRRGSSFSFADASNAVECSSEKRGGGIRVRRGMVAGLNEDEEGIVPVVEG